MRSSLTSIGAPGSRRRNTGRANRPCGPATPTRAARRRDRRRASARRSGRPARIRRRRRRSSRPSGRRSRTRSSPRRCGSAMPITSLTCTSRQARTQRLHWMQASRLTRIAGWLASGGQRGRAGKAARRDADAFGPCPERRVGSCEVARAGWSATQQFHHHARAAFGALASSVWTFMPARRLAACRRRPARARPRSRPCRRGNCRPADSRARASGRDAGSSMPSRFATCQIVSPGRPRPARRRARRRSVAAPGDFGRVDAHSAASRRSSSGKYLHDRQQRVRRRLARARRSRRRASPAPARRAAPGPSRPLHQPTRLLRADPAGRALAAALVLEEAHQVERRASHVVLVREHHDRGRADEAAVLLQRAEIERDVAMRRGQDAARGAAGR